MTQERYFVLTKDTINFFDTKGMFVRHYELRMIMAFIKTQAPSEVAILINEGKDFRFGSLSEEQVQTLQNTLKEAFANNCGNQQLKLYAVPDSSLKKYINSSSLKY